MHMTRRWFQWLIQKIFFLLCFHLSRILFRSNTFLYLVFTKWFCWQCGGVGILFSTLIVSKKESLKMLSVSIWISKSGTSCSDVSTDPQTSILSYCNIYHCWDCWNIKFTISLMAYIIFFSLKTFGTIRTLKV